MRRWGNGIAGKALATIAVAGAVLIGQPLTASAAPGPLTITPLGWNVIGLDSNNVTTGPDTFPIGGRVCNTGTNPVTNVGVNWSWLSTNTYVSLANTTSFSTASLAAGACRDYYFNVKVTRNASAYDTARQFQITATGDTVSAVSTPTNREVYVEKLVSQNRNAVNSWTLSNTPGCNPATGVVYVGSTCTATIVSKTATNGYEQLVNAYYFNNSMFRIESLTNAYDVPTSYTNTQMYADACGWNNDRTSGTYRSCVGPDLISGGKVGGNPITTTISFTVIGTGSQALTGIIYDFSGASFHYNNDGGSSPNLLTLTATQPPTAPTAVNDTASTNEDTTVDIDVLANDSDINGNLNPSSLSVATQPSNGSASVVGGQVRYSPAANFNGVDTFTYQICDSTSPTPLCATATVTVTVNAVNDPPDAVNDSRTINEDSSLTFDPRGNDTDPDGDSLTVTGVGSASNGVVSFTGTSVTYTPNANWSGTDSFTYTISDGNGGTDTATVTVTVDPMNDPPDAVNDSRTINEDSSLTFDPRGNDTDPEGDSLTVTGVGSASNGVVSFTGTSVTYTPSLNWSGTDSFTYTISDGNGGTDTATVTVTVDPVNDPPVAADDSDSVDEDSSVTVGVLGNDADVDDGLDPSSVTVTSGPSNGSTSVNLDGSIDYTPDADFSGTDSFTYEVCDLAGACDSATVTITVNEVNDPPVAVDDLDSVDEDSSVTVDVLGNDSDPDDGLDPSSVTVTSGPSNGSTSVNVDGSIDYTPDPDFFGSDSFTYEVCDFAGDCDSATVDITVNSVNDPPTALDDFDSVDEDSSVTVGVLGNDADVDDGLDPSSVTVTSGPSNGSTSVNVDGSIDYTPDADFSGMDSFTYEVCDLAGDCDSATVTITVNEVNDPPVAVDDLDSVDEDSSVTVDVLGNDSDPDDGLDPSSVTVTSGPTNGSTNVNLDGSIDYTPDADFSGSDSFTYEVCDLAGDCDSATVTITVNEVNDPPVAVDDSDSVDEDSSVTVDVLGNDTDPDDGLDTNSVTVTSGPSNGSTSVNVDGSIDYTPDPDFSGSDSFTYEVCDLAGDCDTATVDITVDPVNDPPTADDDFANVDQDTPQDIDVQANDGDVDGDVLTTLITSPPSNGSVSVNVDGSVRYTPDPGYIGNDSFTYEVCDPSLECAPATVYITVSDLPEPPDAVDDSDSVDEDSSVTVDVLGNDTDPEGDIDPSSVTVTSGPGNGSTSVNPDGSIDYTPDADFSGTDSFTYEVCDTTPLPVGPGCDTATVTITVNEVNDPPTAVDDSDSVDEDSSVTVDVLGNDSDPDDGLDASSVTVTSGPSNGSTSVNVDGSIDYTPDPDFSGTDSFTYEVCDLAGDCDSATVTITVNEVNDPPVAVDDSDSVDEDSSVTVDVLGNDSDPDDGLDASSVTVTSGPSNGSTSVNVDGSIDYTPDADFSGTDSFTYEVCDLAGDCDSATVTITVNEVNDPPTAVDDSDSVDEDSSVTVDVLGNDSDPDDGLDPSSVTVTSGPSNGSTSVNLDGSIDYTPDPDFSGSDSFTYEVCDFAGDCVSATVDITVNSVNDPPVAVDDSDSVDEDSSVTVDVLGNDSDPDDGLDPSSVTVTSGPSNGSTSVNLDGSIDYTPDADFSGSDSFTYEVCDLAGDCDSATVTITVNEVNDPPVAVDDSDSVDEDSSVTVDVLGNDSDPDDGLDPSSVTVTSGPSNGSTSVNLDGSIDYTPDPDFSGTDGFTYEVCDFAGDCDTATVDITVDPVNDPPTADDDFAYVDQDTPKDIDVQANDGDIDGDTLTTLITSGPSNGSVSVNVDGSVRYTPDPGYIGGDSFTYEVCDPSLECAPATVYITVSDLPEPPDAVDDSDSVDEDNTVTIDVLGNDTDPEGDIDPSSVTVTSGPSNGSTSVNPDGSIDYTPDPNFSGSDSFTYEVCDTTPLPVGPGCDTATVTITVNPVNDPPVAVNDSDSVDEDSTVTVDVLANDSDVDDGLDPSSVSITSGPSNGSVSVNLDGSIDYTPDPDFSGTDSFRYEVCDLAGDCDTARVDITVNEVNDPPTARNDSDSVDEDASVTVDVLGNDSDPDDGLDPASVTVTGAPVSGSTSVNVDGSIDYTPDPDFFGSDSFTYEVCDFAGDCDSATVDITVNSINDGPDAIDDTALVDEDDTVTIDVLDNDTDVEGAIDPSSVTVTSGPSNGSTSVNPDGSIDYTPDPDFFGTDSFIYEVCDVDGDCDTATVTVTVSSINDGPNARDDSDSVDQDSSVTVDVLGNDTDIDDGLDPSTVSVTSGPSNGSTSVNLDGSIDYTPDPGFSGSDSFTYEVCDFAGACDTATVDITVNPVNAPPVALDDSAAGIWGDDIDIDVLGNDSDPDGSLDASSVTVTSGPSNGSTTVNLDGSITYVADDNFVGIDSFDYEVCDDGTPTECDTATVTITVSANLGPDAVDDTATVDEDSGPVTIDVLDNDSDPEGGPLTVTSAGPPSNGSVTINADGSIDYTPDPDFSGIDTFTYTVCDDAGNCSMATVTVTVNEVNDAPRARNDSGRVQEGRTITVGVMANDSDSDNALDPASVRVVTPPTHGSASINPDGSVDFTADAGYDGPDSFVYEVCDDGAPVECDTATVRLDIWQRDTNRRPNAVDDSATTPEDTPVTINVRGNDTDPDGDALSISSFSQPRHGSVERSGGRLVFTPDKNWNGTTTFTYVVCDPDGRCDDATVTVTVDPVDDAPIANDDAIVVKDGKPVTIPVVDNDDEVDGEPVTISIVDQPRHGTVTVEADGTVVYTPDGGYDGPDEFSYEICDPDGDCSEATVSVEVQGASQPPAEPQKPSDPAPTPQSGQLPHTGGDVTRLALWGVTLLLMGVALVGRRRIRVS